MSFRQYSLRAAILVILAGAALAGCRLFPPNQAPFEPHRDLSGGLPVFPGAEGFGSTTVAGRDGEVLRVTSLAGEGPGSFREAAEASGARVVIFEVGGVIALESNIVVTEPFITIAGQTAPDPGITLVGGGLVVSTHDVLVQHIRSRPGDRDDGVDPENRDGIAVVGTRRGDREVYNVVVDHCSVSWAIDEGASTWYDGVHDVTFSNCIIAENLSESLHPKGEHSKGLLVGDHSRRIAVLGNLFAHNTRRNPLLKGDTTTVVAGNLICNPGTQAVGFSDPEWSGRSLASIIANVFIPGESTDQWTELVWRGRETSDDIQVYLDDNLLLLGVDDPAPSTFTPGERISQVLVSEPPVSFLPFTLPAADNVVSTLLLNAGARPAARDVVDARIVQSVIDGTGIIIDSQEEVGGYPDPDPATRALTLPDNPGEDADLDGYTNLEEWLHDFSSAVQA
jgi:hypothetical protein